MILPVIYACLMWFFAAKYRRQWPGVLTVVLGLSVLALIGSTSLTDDRGAASSGALFTIPVGLRHGLRLFMVLLVPYGAMVGLVAVFLVCLPRPKFMTGCKGCGYDLSGLNPLGLICPECGLVQGPYRCLRCAHDLRGLEPAGLVCPNCAEPWTGPGSGRESDGVTLTPILMGPVKPRRRSY
ncbi:MAG: hypothetical protein ACK4WH_08980 [Phycisphaerales bacterium]